MYDFSKCEISEPVKTIIWLLQNKPERFSVTENRDRIQIRGVDNKTGKVFEVLNAGHGNMPYVLSQDWMTLDEKLYLAQELILFIKREQEQENQKEKEKWLEVYREDIGSSQANEEAEVIEIKSPELSSLEKAAQEHTTGLMAQAEKEKDMKRMWIMGFLAGACLVIPLIVLLASR